MSQIIDPSPQVKKKLRREPLVHFVLIGLLIFTIDKFVLRSAVDENVIVVDKVVTDEIVQQFQTQNKRVPTDKELLKLQDAWLHTELLYRKGLALGLDKNDAIIRDRIVQKTEFLFKNLAKINEPNDKQLLQLYHAKAGDYQKPPRYDFEHVLVRDGYNNAKQKAEAILKQITNGVDAQSFEQSYHVFVARKRIGLKVTFGEAFVDALDQLPNNQWQIVHSKKGWHVLRLQAKQQDPLPAFEKIRPLLRADWYKQQQRKQVAKLIDELRDSYVINRDPT